MTSSVLDGVIDDILEGGHVGHYGMISLTQNDDILVAIWAQEPIFLGHFYLNNLETYVVA